MTISAIGDFNQDQQPTSEYQPDNSPQAIAANADTLRHEDHIQWDRRLLRVVRSRLNAIMDLMSMGLVEPIGNVGVTLSQYERMGDMTKAQIDMDGLTESQFDRLTFDEVGVPVPVIHKDFRLNWRTMEASMRSGTPLSSESQNVAARVVADELEEMLVNGVPGFSFDGKTIYGYTSHPNRNTVTIIDWVTAASSTTPGRIIGDVVKLRQALHTDHRFGPYVLYVARDIWTVLEQDYNVDKGDRTLYERILAFSDINSVKHLDTLANGQVLLIEMNEQTVDLAVAQDIQRVQWHRTMWQTEYKVYALMVPRIKVDRNNSSGIAHGSR